jgi:hypothetical protein
LSISTQAYSQTTRKGSVDIEIRYTEENNETVVETSYMLANIPSSSSLKSVRFYAWYKYLGKEQAIAEKIDLSFLIEPCEHDLGIVIRADGMLFHSDSLLGFCFVSGLRDRLWCTVSLPYGRFQELTEAEDVEIDLGRTSFRLIKAQKEALKVLLQETKQ